MIDDSRTNQSIALLKKWGIDANLVAANGWDEEGYESFALDAGGLPVFASGERIRYRHDWPINFPIEKLIEIRGGVGR